MKTMENNSELNEYFIWKPKKGTEDNISVEEQRKIWREKSANYRKENEEQCNKYSRESIRRKRNNEPKKKRGRPPQPPKILSEEELKEKKKKKKNYMAEYFQKPEVKEEKKGYSKAYMKDRREYKNNPDKNISFKEWRIQKRNNSKGLEAMSIVNHIKEIKKYPDNFPIKEFNKRLDELLGYNPIKVEEKILQDSIHDILEKGNSLTIERMVLVYTCSDWKNAICKIMNSKGYTKDGDEYIKI